MYTLHKKHIFYSVFFILGLLLIPHLSQANYSFNGKTFDTYDDMMSYVVAYMEAWREVYGDTTHKTRSNTIHRDYTAKRNDLLVETSRTRNVSYDSARFIGKIDFKDSDRVRIWFDYGTSPHTLTTRTATQVLSSTFGDRTFDKKAFNLIPETTYYYRAGAINEEGAVDYGDIESFTTAIDTETQNALVRARTYSASDIDDNRARVRGRVYLPRDEIAYTWFTYGDDEDDLYAETAKNVLHTDDTRNISEMLTRLDDDETYYYRFLAMDRNGDISYGDIRSFTTRAGIADERPEIETVRYSDVGIHTATLNGEVDMNDFNDGVVFMLYGEDSDKIYDVAEDYDEFEDISERGDDRQIVLLDADSDRYNEYSVRVSDLDEHTTYYYAIGVEFENEDHDEEILLGRVSSLRTKRDR